MRMLTGVAGVAGLVLAGGCYAAVDFAAHAAGSATPAPRMALVNEYHVGVPAFLLPAGLGWPATSTKWGPAGMGIDFAIRTGGTID